MKRFRMYATIVSLSVMVTALLLPGVLYASDFSAASFVVKDPVVTQGGGYATSSQYRLWSSIGQVAIGTGTASSFRLKSGFLYFPVAATSAPATPAGQTVVSTGGAGFLGIIKKLFPQKEPITPTTLSRFDLSGNGTIGMADLSIVLYFFNKPPSFIASLGFPGKTPDFNGDGFVNLVDVSILLFYWT